MGRVYKKNLLKMEQRTKVGQCYVSFIECFENMLYDLSLHLMNDLSAVFAAKGDPVAT